MESRPLVTHFPCLSIWCGREGHWSRVHWGRGRGAWGAATATAARAATTGAAAATVESAACRAGAHGGSQALKFKATIVSACQVDCQEAA